jgi:hypothetical protein
VACPAIPHFSTWSRKWQDFRKKIQWILTACFDFLYKYFWKHFSFSEEFSDILWSMCIRLSVSNRYSYHTLMQLESSTDFRKHTQISNFMKIRPVGAKLPHADGWRQSDRHILDKAKISQVVLAHSFSTSYCSCLGQIPGSRPATNWMTVERAPAARLELFFSAPFPDSIWNPPSLLSSALGSYFPGFNFLWFHPAV